MTENNIDDLRKARYMSLSCPPASPEAKSLVEDIIDIITNRRARKADEVPESRSMAFRLVLPFDVEGSTFKTK